MINWSTFCLFCLPLPTDGQIIWSSLVFCLVSFSLIKYFKGSDKRSNSFYKMFMYFLANISWCCNNNLFLLTPSPNGESNQYCACASLLYQTQERQGRPIIRSWGLLQLPPIGPDCWSRRHFFVVSLSELWVLTSIKLFFLPLHILFCSCILDSFKIFSVSLDSLKLIYSVLAPHYIAVPI